MVHDRCNSYFSFWTTLFPFTPPPPPLPPPPNSLKNKNFKKMKKHQDISSFYTSVPKIMIICYTVPEIRHVMDAIIFHFGLFCALYPLMFVIS